MKVLEVNLMKSARFRKMGKRRGPMGPVEFKCFVEDWAIKRCVFLVILMASGTITVMTSVAIKG